VTYKTHPAITSLVSLNINITYTPPSYRELLKTYLLLQPTMSAHNFSGSALPVNTPDPSTNSTMFVAKLFVFNSVDIIGANSTLRPLYDFVERETGAGRPMRLGVQSRVLTDYFQLWSVPIDQIDEGAGRNAIMGSRLLPISLFEEGKVDPLVDLLAQSQMIPSIVSGELYIVCHYR
jgi:hypothetical protein